jgi:outer membrane protein assembly factor BamB
VFVGSGDSRLYAFDAATGARKWSHDFGAPHGFLLASPVIAGGVLFIGGGSDNWIRAVDPSDGTLLWSYETGNQLVATPAVVNGWVYIGSFDDYLYAFHLPG